MWQKTIKAGAFFSLFLPVPAFAQPAEACGSADTLLMHCTFDQGAKQVGLCLNSGTISYEFGRTFSDPELTLISDFAAVDYIPFGWASSTLYESVTLFNGNTSYDVFTALPRGEYQAQAEGGVTVTLPDQQRIALTCDPGSVTPNDPLSGIGQLTQLSNAVQYNPIGVCLKGLIYESPASDCLGKQRAADIANGICDPAVDSASCWTPEAAIWEQLLEKRFEDAKTRISTHHNGFDIGALIAAQDAWNTSRNLDCEIYISNPFADDGGKAECLSETAANRVTFLDKVVGGVEFDG